VLFVIYIIASNDALLIYQCCFDAYFLSLEIFAMHRIIDA